MNSSENTVKIIPISPNNEDAQKLIAKLDQYQIGLYGRGPCTLESVDELKKNKAYMLGAYIDDTLAGIGAVKLFDTYAEIKRMYIEEDFRRMGVAEKILSGLEDYARQQDQNRVRLETGTLHHAALKFYKKSGYYEIERFGSYKDNPISVCFEKAI